MNSLKKKWPKDRRNLLDNLFRFTDDLNTTNDGGEFENNLQDISPE